MRSEHLKVEPKRCERQCPLCWEPARVLGNVACPDCDTRYHRECADELGGGCATLGCGGHLPTTLSVTGDFLDRFQGRPRFLRRTQPSRLGRRWAQARARFSVGHAAGASLLIGLLGLILMRRLPVPPLVQVIVLGVAMLLGGVRSGLDGGSIWNGRAREFDTRWPW